MTPDADDEETPEADEEETPEADDEETPAADDEETPEADEEETPEGDEEDAEPTRNVLLGEDDEETPAADDDEPQAESGIDGATYTSPTYGYTVAWDDDVWIANPDAETRRRRPRWPRPPLHRAPRRRRPVRGFYIEGKADYDGDVADCIEGEETCSATMRR